MNTKILIDVSYLIYNSFFKSKRQYLNKYNIEITDNYDWNSNKRFMKIIERNIKNNIYRIRKHFGVKYNDIIFMRDCLRETIWRTKIYPKYKANRSSLLRHNNVNQNLGNLFIYLYNEYLPKILTKFNINIVKIEEAEADDIIFIFAKLLDKNGFKTIIIGNDSDFYQILNDNIHMYDLSLIDKKYIKDPKKYLLYKILSGDKSDNIYGLKIKKKEFLKNKLPNIVINNKLFLNNRKLIDCKGIPLYIKDKIYKEYKKII